MALIEVTDKAIILKQIIEGKQGLPGKDGITTTVKEVVHVQEEGKAGATGATPEHEVRNGEIRFKHPDGTWGEWITVQPSSSGSGGVLEVFNNTFININTIHSTTKTNNPVYKNNIIQGTTNGITGTVASASDYNSTDDADFGTGYTTNTNDRVSQTFTFVDAGADDFHLASGDTGAKDEGVDLSADTDSIDIDAEDISAPWSIGADWVPSSGLDISPTGIVSAEAFGTAVITTGAVDISPTGIASAEAFGSHTVANVQTLSPSGIASEEAFGTAVLTTGAVTLTPTGITSAEAFGTHDISQATFLTPTGIASTEAFGTAVITTGAVILTPTGISSEEAFGSHTVVAVGDKDIKIDFANEKILATNLESTTLYYNGNDYFSI